MYKKLYFLISFVLVLTLASTSYGASPFFKLDMDASEDVNTEPGFTSFLLEESGREVNGITIEFFGDLLGERRRAEPNAPDGDWYHELYRDFIFCFYPDGIEMTLWGLGAGRKCDITIYAFDVEAGFEPRVANWSTPTEPNIIQTWFEDTENILNWPGNIGDKNWYAFTGTGIADELGRIILKATIDPCSNEGETFSFINALIVAPNSTGPVFIPVEEATIPRPVNKQERVPPDDVLKWRPGAYANKHDVYLGTDKTKVTTATRGNPQGVLVSENQDANTYDWNGYIHMDKTYYWRIDEVNSVSATIWPGEVWHFTVRDHVVVDDFDSYVSSDALKEVWNDWWYNGTSAEVFIDDVIARDGISMRYFYDNDYELFYSDAEASVATLGLESDWLSGDAKSLSLWFYGRAGNPVSEQMYMGLTDGDGNTAFVPYDGDMNDVKKEEWQEWNVLLQDFVDANNVNLTNVASITISFGEPGGSVGTEGTVNFDDFKLHPSRCALSKRSAALAKVDYSPGGLVAGDCVVDYLELDLMGSTWLFQDSFVETEIPSEVNLIVYYSMEPEPNVDPCDPNILGIKPYPYDVKKIGIFSEFGVTFSSSGVVIGNDPCNSNPSHAAFHPNCVSFDGQVYSEYPGDPNRNATGIRCGRYWTPLVDSNDLTLAVWIKWAGPHVPFRQKCQPIISMRRDWNANGTLFFFECDTYAAPRGSFAFRQFSQDIPSAVYSASGILDGTIGQWTHLAAVVEPNYANPEDPNNYVDLYLNGAPVLENGPFRYGNGDPCTITLTIGNHDPNGNYIVENFNGEIDEIYIYNRILGPNEVAYLADTTPADGVNQTPVPSAANLIDPEPPGQRYVNFNDFAVLTDMWLHKEYWP